MVTQIREVSQLRLVIFFSKVTFIGLALSYCSKLYVLIVETIEDTEKQKENNKMPSLEHNH